MESTVERLYANAYSRYFQELQGDSSFMHWRLDE